MGDKRREVPDNRSSVIESVSQHTDVIVTNGPNNDEIQYLDYDGLNVLEIVPLNRSLKFSGMCLYDGLLYILANATIYQMNQETGELIDTGADLSGTNGEFSYSDGPNLGLACDGNYFYASFETSTPSTYNYRHVRLDLDLNRVSISEAGSPYNSGGMSFNSTDSQIWCTIFAKDVGKFNYGSNADLQFQTEEFTPGFLAIKEGNILVSGGLGSSLKEFDTSGNKINQQSWPYDEKHKIEYFSTKEIEQNIRTISEENRSTQENNRTVIE